MTSELLVLREKPDARHLIAGWRRQWSDGGEISSGLPRYLIDKFNARHIGEFTPVVSKDCYPFQVPGTHDTYRPRVEFKDGLPVREMHRRNYFYDAGDGLIVFLGEEPWMRIDVYGQAFLHAVKELGVSQTVLVEGYNGAAPPDQERNVSCTYSQPEMREELERYGLRFSNYGSRGRNGPTIGMAMITMAHDLHPDMKMVRLGAMAPMYPFLNSSNEPVGITKDHQAYYDIMRRVRAMLGLDLDLDDLVTLAKAECQELQRTLERIGSSNPRAKQLIDQAKADYTVNPFIDPLEPDGLH